MLMKFINPLRLYGMVEHFWFKQVPVTGYEVMRIGLGICSLLNVSHLWFYRLELYSDIGFVPYPSTWGVWVHKGNFWSLFSFFGSPGEVTFIFVVAFIASLGLIFGCASRVSMLVIFLFSLSYSHRAFITLSGYDAIFRILSFTLLFSPIGNKWSVDNLIIKK